MAEGGEKVKGANPNPNSKDGDTDMEAEIKRLQEELVSGGYYGKPEMDVTKGFHFIYTCLGQSLYVDEMQHQKEAPICISGYQACYVREKVPDSDSFSRFKRNANVAASGVAKNVREVGKQLKERIDDILHPSRRPPK